MRVSSTYFTRNLPAQMTETQSRLSETQSQIATGRKFQRPSDNPSGAGNLIIFQQMSGKLQQFERNAQFAETRLNLEESTLASISDTLVSVREIALQVNSDTYAATDRAVMLHELSQLKTHLVNLANSVDAHGKYLFSGGAVGTPAYEDQGSIVYLGDSNRQFTQIGVGSELLVRLPGNEIFEVDVAGGTSKIFDTLTDFEKLLGPDGIPPENAEFHVEIGEVIEKLDVGYQHLLGIRSNTGTRLAAIDNARQSNSSVEKTVETQVAEVVEVDLVEAISRMEAEAQALQAIQATYSRLQQLSLFDVI